MTTTQLKALIAIAASNSFSSAGREIGVSQSSLHRSGRDLENLLGVTLFEKNSLGISPTKAALILTRAAKLAFSEINQAREEINSLNNIEIGHMLIGSMPLARTSILPNSIIDFTHHYPDFKFSILDGPYDDLLSHLKFGDIDILIGALRFPTPKEYVVQEELFSSSVVIVARPNHPYLTKNRSRYTDPDPGRLGCSPSGRTNPDNL
ncbi:LysR family transcriptional regulator [Vibrio sp. PP-XX7]